MWSVKQVEQADQPPDANVAEVKLEQELNHDAVVESIAAVPKKGMLLAGGELLYIYYLIWKLCFFVVTH